MMATLQLTKNLCFVCNSQLPNGNDKFVENGDVILFAVKYILGIDDCLKETRRREEGELSSHQEMIRMCRNCHKKVEKARELYKELSSIAREFRCLQKEIVEEIKSTKPISRRRRGQIVNDDGIVEELRQFVRDNEYQSDPSSPFLIEFEKPSVVPIKEEVDSDGNSNICENTESPLNSTTDFRVDSPEDLQENDDDDDWRPTATIEDSSDNQEDTTTENYEENTKRKKTIRSKRKRKIVVTADSDDNEDEDPQQTGSPRSPSVSRKRKRGRPFNSTSYQNNATHAKPNSHCVCEFCGKSHSGPAVLEHLRTHVGDEYLRKCLNPDCDHVYSHMFALRKHLSKGVCRFVLKKADPNHHFMQKRKHYMCEECGTVTPGVDHLRAHMTKSHENYAPVKERPCPISGCQEIFAIRPSLEMHLFLEHDIINEKSTCKHQKCYECSDWFAYTDAEHHLRNVHKAEMIRKCQQCPFMYSKWEHIFEHSFYSHRHSGVPFFCDICSDEGTSVLFANDIELRQHFFDIHSIGEQYVCDLCNKVFWRKRLLEGHKTGSHIGYPCDICDSEGANGVTFSTAMALKTHKVKVHGEQPFKCEFCEDIFKSNVLRQKHVRIVHKNKFLPKKGPWRCNQPGCEELVFEEMRRLQTHRYKMHKGKEHVCEKCGVGFYDRSSLERHKGSHENIRQFVCDNCGFKFKSASALKIHMAVHTEIDPFVCEECGKKYKWKKDLMKHIKSCHQENECKTEQE